MTLQHDEPPASQRQQIGGGFDSGHTINIDISKQWKLLLETPKYRVFNESTPSTEMLTSSLLHRQWLYSMGKKGVCFLRLRHYSIPLLGVSDCEQCQQSYKSRYQPSRRRLRKCSRFKEAYRAYSWVPKRLPQLILVQFTKLDAKDCKIFYNMTSDSVHLSHRSFIHHQSICKES